jgi:hypothetical protein
MSKKVSSDLPRLAFAGVDSSMGESPFGFHGLMTTVRLGIKWAKLFHDGWREAVVLDGHGNICGEAELIEAYYLPLYRVANFDLSIYHDGSMPSLRLLRADLAATYGSCAKKGRRAVEPITPNTMVTVLTFREKENV